MNEADILREELGKKEDALELANAMALRYLISSVNMMGLYIEVKNGLDLGALAAVSEVIGNMVMNPDMISKENLDNAYQFIEDLNRKMSNPSKPLFNIPSRAKFEATALRYYRQWKSTDKEDFFAGLTMTEDILKKDVSTIFNDSDDDDDDSDIVFVITAD